MKNFALLNDQNIVVNISIGDDNWSDNNWIEFTNDNPAYIGGDYVDGYFYPAQPYASWTRNNGQWVSPSPRPEGINWYWDESTLSWIDIES
jgi:hypothetical protein